MVVGLWKKPKDLSTSEREECGYGEGVSTKDVRESTLCTYDVVQVCDVSTYPRLSSKHQRRIRRNRCVTIYPNARRQPVVGRD